MDESFPQIDDQQIAAPIEGHSLRLLKASGERGHLPIRCNLSNPPISNIRHEDISGLVDCEACVCDVNSSGGISATDAQLVLTAAVALPADLVCPVCQ